jgi:release factor glutamine methyltransferase
MTVARALQEGRSRLVYAEVDTPLLDATVLLCEALATTKERLLASLPELLPEEAYRRYRGLLDRRAAGIPVSYLRGRKEFFSLEFAVDPRVLVPRPDTEILVEEALRILNVQPTLRRVHDACTGSGCVAIALKHSRPELELSASDLDPAVREVFEGNALRLLGGELAPGRGLAPGGELAPGVGPIPRTGAIPFVQSDLLGSLAGPFDLITANPPYLTDLEVEQLLKIGWPEPPRALRGGPDGMSLLERLIREAPRCLARPGWLLLEAAPAQMQRLGARLAEVGFEEITVTADLGGRERVIRGTLA